MKNSGLLSGLLLTTSTVHASLPVITSHPTNRTVTPNQTVTFHVASTNATGFQWRYNGIDIPWGTTSALVVTNAQTNHNGYYMAIAKNGTGWTPSQMAYLSVVWSNGILPFYNTNVQNAQARYSWNSCLPPDFPITNGVAQFYAGPQMDQLLPVGAVRPVRNGYFGPETTTRLVPTVPPGATSYCRVDITYTPSCGGPAITQPSTVIQLLAGGGSLPVQLPTQLRFPNYIEWPDYGWIYEPTSRVGVAGETMTLYASFYWPWSSTLTVDWRKDGKVISSATNLGAYYGVVSLTLTNLTDSDCGVYDVVGYGADGMTRNKLFLSVQTAGGSGLLKHPKLQGANFMCDLEGAYSRKYAILSSTNLLNWTSNLTVTLGEQTSTVTFTVSTPNDVKRFYRARLVPIPQY